MLRSLNKLTIGIVVVVIFASISLAGCSSNVSQTTPSSSSGQSSSSSEQSTTPSTQQQQPNSSGQGQQPGGPNMTAVLDRAAEILGVSSDAFTTAFQNAMPENAGSGQQGERPTPPSGQQGEPPTGTPPSGQQGEQPAMPDMTDVYTKMATELNISADDIAAAMTQAQQELKK